VDCLELSILKRRGPPLLNALELPARGKRLAALLNARKATAVGPAPSPAPGDRRSHALDRAASIA
jgi:protein ImuA